MRYTLLLLFVLCVSTVRAVKMCPGGHTVRQSDGTTLRIKGFGNQDFNYLTTTDGVLLYQEGTDYYVAKVYQDGMLGRTDILAHEKDSRSDDENKLIAMQNRTLFTANIQSNEKKARMKREPMTESPTLLQHTGTPKVPVILVEFSDSTFTVDKPGDVFDKYLNAIELFNRTDDPEMGMNYGSVKRYFTDMSFGKFSPDFDVYGPVKLDKPLKHYGAGYSSAEDMNALFYDACNAVDKEVDFSQYDSNSDGYVDLVYIIYAGYSQSIAGNSTDCIHPKSGTLSADIEVDGKRILRYGVNNELNGTPSDQAAYGLLINGIGLFCHEFSHCMGLPDIYPAAGSIAERCINQNMDYWDLMDAGEYTREGYCPTEYTSWERERFGWTVIDTLNTSQDIVLKALSDGGKAYRILNDKDESGKEYYIVENVQKKGWNKYLPGHGMLVMHVDYDDYYFSLGGCKVNSTPGHPRMSLIAADGMFMPEYFTYTTITEGVTDEEKTLNKTLTDRYNGMFITSAIYKEEASGDPFPGTGTVTELTDSSTPAAWVYTGGYMGKSITDIVENDTEGVISFKFMGGKETGVKTLQANPLNGKIFSPDGRYMGTDRTLLDKGVYIINQKKVVL